MERSSAGAWKIQQRAVGRHKQRRSDSSALASCLQKESKHGRTAGALFSDPPGNGGDGLPGALRLTSCYGLLRATKKLASSKLRASASNSRIVWLTGTVTPLFFAGCSYGGAKIENEAYVFALARFLIGLSKQRGRVNCCENFWRKLRRQHFAALARNAERWPEDRLCGGRAETNQQCRFHQAQ